MRFTFVEPPESHYYVAKITGFDRRYGYKRSFLKENTPPRRSMRPTYMLSDGLYEIEIGVTRTYLAIVNNRQHEINADDLAQTKRICSKFNVKLEAVLAQWTRLKKRSTTTLTSVVKAITRVEADEQKQARRERAAMRKRTVATMTAEQAFDGSCGNTTKMFLGRLCSANSDGWIAAALFSAQKASTRAKLYRGKNCGRAYQRKGNELNRLCALLDNQSKFTWGWKMDSAALCAKWVLYIDLPQGQVSFHSKERWVGPEYLREWDKQHASEERILAYCDLVLENLSTDLSIPPSDVSAEPAGDENGGSHAAIAIARD